MKIFLFAFSFLFFSSCYKNNLYVQQEWITNNYLASQFVASPDPLQKNPPLGEKILISWQFPSSVFEKKLQLELFVRFYDNTEQMVTEKITYKKGYTSYFFPNPTGSVEKNILTYKVIVSDPLGETVDIWQHQLWVEKIGVDEEVL